MVERDHWGFYHRQRIAWAVFAPAVVLTIFTKPIGIEGTWLDIGFDVVAWSLFGLGALLRFWSTLYMGGRKRKELVTEGPYSLCRNPLYLGTTLIALSAGCFVQSPSILAALAVSMVLYAASTVPVEERFLAEHFGDAYARYCRRTPRFLPAFRAFNAGQTLTVDMTALYRECTRSIAWVWIPFGAEVLGMLRAEQWWPAVHFF